VGKRNGGVCLFRLFDVHTFFNHNNKLGRQINPSFISTTFNITFYAEVPSNRIRTTHTDTHADIKKYLSNP
jgi:hypothetical protein